MKTPSCCRVLASTVRRRLTAFGLALLSVSPLAAQPVYLPLTNLFTVDAVLEAGGTALTDPLETDRERIDGQTLPPTYSDNVAFTAADGSTSFLFAPLKKSSLDALAVNGQTLTVPAGNYGSAEFALFAAPGGYGDPFSTIRFRYTDGSSVESRFGPVPGWVASPTAYDHSYYNYTDSSGVKSLISFATDWSTDEEQYIYDSFGNGNSGGWRFVDGTGFVLYRLLLPAEVTEATLGVTVGNNFVISLASQFADPWVSTTEGYTEVANSMKLYTNYEHKALGNLKLYEFPLKPFLTNGTGEIYILFTDATPSNGWGPYIQRISAYTGTNRVFAQELVPALKTNNATMYAEFLTDGGAAEAPYLYDNSGSGPSNRKHRFADGSGSLTYHFDFPDTVTNAKLTVDMANNFVVAVTGPIDVTRYAQVTPGAANEKDFLVDEGNSVLGGSGYRFADASAYMVYQFDLPDDVTNAIAQITVGNQFVIEVAPGLSGAFVKERDYVAETGNEITDNSNLATYDINLTPYLVNNAEKIVRIQLSDGKPDDGWGPYLTGITIANQPSSFQPSWQTVLDSMTLFGVDVHNEANKDYYTIDLASVLQTNNAKKEVYVKFTDGSTSDGWGPGLFWMAAYSGTLEIQSDAAVFAGLKAMNGDPAPFDLSVIRRSYALNSTKTLKEIVLPVADTNLTSKAYLMAATLTPAAAEAVKLSARRGTGNTLVLAWPASAAAYHPEGAAALSGPWTTVEGTVEVGTEEATLSTTISGTARFYRLKK